MKKILNFIEAVNSGKEFTEYDLDPRNVKVKWKMDGGFLKRFPPNGNYWYNDGGEFIGQLINKSFIIVPKKS